MCEVVDMLLPLLETPGNSNKKQDQLVLLMYEPNMAELLYVLLADGSYPVTLKEKILKVSVGHFMSQELKYFSLSDKLFKIFLCGP